MNTLLTDRFNLMRDEADVASCRLTSVDAYLPCWATTMWAVPRALNGVSVGHDQRRWQVTHRFIEENETSLIGSISVQLSGQP